MFTNLGFGRTGVVMVVTATCVLVLSSAGLATAQGRRAERSRIVTVPDVMSGGQIGITIDDVTDATEEGALVRRVRPDGPAATAGFADGDVIVAFDGERVRSARQLTRHVRETPPGRPVSVTVTRDAELVELEVTPEEGAAMAAARGTLERLGDIVGRVTPGASPDFTYGFRGALAPARLGVSVQELTPQLADFFGVADGLLVSSVDEGSAGADADLQAGDVITAVDGRAVADTDALRRRLSAVGPGEETSITVTRAGRELELAATIGEPQRTERPRLQRFGNAGRGI
jgi:serine protease Do